MGKFIKKWKFERKRKRELIWKKPNRTDLYIEHLWNLPTFNKQTNSDRELHDKVRVVITNVQEDDYRLKSHNLF